MSGEENKVCIRRSIEAFNRRNIEGFFDAFAPTCIFHEPPIEVPATLAEEKQRIPHTFAAFPDLQIVLEDLTAPTGYATSEPKGGESLEKLAKTAEKWLPERKLSRRQMLEGVEARGLIWYSHTSLGEGSVLQNPL